MVWWYLIIIVILVEATTNIISKSQLFEPVRIWIEGCDNRWCKFIHKAVDCPYCFSVWVSLFYACVLYLYVNSLLPSIFLWAGYALIVHRLSNILHFIIDRLDAYHLILPKE